jgi:hypothetical protein
MDVLWNKYFFYPMAFSASKALREANRQKEMLSLVGAGIRSGNNQQYV